MADPQDESDNGGDTSHFFVDGFVVRRDAIIMPAHFQNSPKPYRHGSCFCSATSGSIHDFDNADVRSVTTRWPVLLDGDERRCALVWPSRRGVFTG